MQNLLQAIAREEGFYITGSRASRNNNPGNLNFAVWETEFGAVLETPSSGEIARFARFPTATQGFQALKELLSHDPYLGLPLDSALSMYAPEKDDNDQAAYLKNVCQWTGATPDTILTPDFIGD